jgi:hypothetical protein
MNINISKNKKITSMLFIIVLFSSIIMVALFRNNLIYHSNIGRYIERRYRQPMTIRVDKELTYKGRTYRIIFSTPKDKKDELYVQCFEETLNGTFYKPTYGAIQGKSKSLHGMICNYLNDGTDNSFAVVYGYNKELEANSFNVKEASNGKLITQDISKDEYFLYTYSNIVYPLVNFKDIHNNDISSIFDDQ